ncbi:hypothetical protein GYB59_13485 [bacterium]|nr:hypothetical protein [bacterium]
MQNQQPPQNSYANTCWMVEDIVNEFDVTDAKARAFLEQIEETLVGCMIQAGWDCIHQLAAETEGFEGPLSAREAIEQIPIPNDVRMAMERLFDETPEENKDRRRMIATCMGFGGIKSFKQACSESDERIDKGVKSPALADVVIPSELRKAMEHLFDETPESSVELRKAIAECLGFKGQEGYEKSSRESDAHLDDVDRRDFAGSMD